MDVENSFHINFGTQSMMCNDFRLSMLNIIIVALLALTYNNGIKTQLLH
jgi:hypothetical protein